jgi:serine phosphatase RsbU (regulator of sigma subunit)
VKYGIRAYATEEHEPDVVLRWLNRFYCENDAFENSESFASVFFARYRPQARTLCYASAGHDGVFLFIPGDGAMIRLEPTGPVIGVFSNGEDLYESTRIDVAPGATLLAVSDGVTEARRDGDLFGMWRLAEAAQRYRNGSLEDLACGITRDAAGFARNRVIDDMAVLAVQFE